VKRVLASVALAALLVAGVLWRVGPAPVAAAFRQISPALLAAALALQALAQLMKAQRWSLVLRAATRTPVAGALGAALVGAAANLVLPARLGELVRVQWVARRGGVSRTLALTAVGVTQLFDLLALGGLLLPLSLAAALRATVGPTAALALVGATLGGLTLVVALHRRPERLQTAMERLARVLPGRYASALRYYADQFTAGLRLLGAGRTLGAALLLTIGAWTLEVASVRLALQAFWPPAGLISALALTVVLNLAFLLPLTPGNVGPHQFLCVAVLGAYGVPAATALAFSLSLQGACAALVLAMGLSALAADGWRASAGLRMQNSE
jgi:hypothetical protein